MAVDFFTSPRVYLQDSDSVKTLICRIDVIIDATLTAMLAGAVDADTKDYRLDDGQTVIRVQKRSALEMGQSVTALEALKQIYVNRFNGHSVRLVDHESTRLLTAV